MSFLSRELILLTDGSLNTQSLIGYGAYLAIADPDQSLAELRPQIKVRRFTQTSSSKLELQTLLWALSEIQASGRRVRVHTDSQNIIGLSARREELEQSDFRSKQNRPLNNSQLYQEFYRLTDQLNCQFIKVRGHQATKQKNHIDHLFTLVDRASRRALRANNKPTAQTAKDI